MRAAIYARYSDDRQSPRSIEDQVEDQRRLAARRGWTVVAVFADAAISGFSMVNRPQFQAAIAAAERGEYDVLMIEDEDRLARDLETHAHVFNRLKDAGVAIATNSTEKLSLLEVAINGYRAEDFLRGHSEKTRRGMRSNAEKGLATGSRIYGYRSAPGGAQTLVEAEAKVVREIFARHAAGETVRAVVADLNARAVPGPGGGLWSPSTLSGNQKRGAGLFACELYVGVKVWNRVAMTKDRRTGARICTPRPPAEWKRVAVPHLRILDDAAFEAVRARRARRAAMTPAERHVSRKGVFSGLIRCVSCGASMTAFNSRGRLICAARREKGPAACANDRSVPRIEIERRVLQGLRTRLLSPDAVRAYVRAYHEAWQAKQAAATADIAPLRKRLQEASRTVERMVDKICQGLDTPATNARLVALEAEKADLAAQLAVAILKAPAPVTLHPRAADAFARRIEALHEALNQDAALAQPSWQAVIAAAREMVVRIDVTYDAQAEGAVAIALHGQLASFMAPSHDRPNDTMRLYKVVAGGGIGLAQTPAWPSIRIAC